LEEAARMAITNPGLTPDEQQILRLLACERPLALIADDTPEERVPLPDRIKSLLFKRILAEFANGHTVTFVEETPKMPSQHQDTN
jgi:hypothetical protein